MSLLSIVASSSAFLLPASPPPKGSSIDSDWSTKNKKQPGFLRLMSAWYAMIFLHFFWHHENYDFHMPEVTGWSPVATCLIAPTGRTRRDPDHRVTDLRRGVAESPSAENARGCDCLTIATDWRSMFSGKKNDGGFGEGSQPLAGVSASRSRATPPFTKR